MKKSNLIFILFVSLLLMQFGFIPNSFAATQESTKLNTSQIKPSSVRIAIYNEPNITQPSYSGYSTFTNNYSALIPILTAAGFSVSELTTQDIYEHKLMTASYDIFIMADNCPKVNISNYVKEFWLGGGGLISFDSALPYLFWAGIIVPESEGDEGFSTYYAYSTNTNNHSIELRHPITQDFQVTDIFKTIGASINYVTWSAMLGTTYGSDLISLAIQEGYPDRTTMFALDPPDKGGKVVHLPGRTAELNTEMEDVFIEAVNWACPRPKGRIAFDMTHNPRLGVDLWDDLTAYPGYYDILRDDLVSRDYLFDKLYPSTSGNLTLTRLNHYDMLIVISPDANYTSNDRNALTTWVHNGGGLLVFGEDPLLADFAITNARLHFLLASFDIAINDTMGFITTVDLVGEEHPSVEGCTDLTVDAYGALNITGTAYPIWKYGPHTMVAGQQSQSGRLIMVADMNWCTNSHIADGDNEQYAINVANWLVSWDAKILLHTDEPNSDNYYVTPVANALNQLGLNYYLTFTEFYFNLSVNLNSWDLIIVDNPWYIIDGCFDSLVGYLDDGGRLIMSTYYASVATPLWAKMGFAYATGLPDGAPLYMWDQYHSIFTTPIDFDLTQFTPVTDYGDEGDLLTVYANATGIAGYTSLESADNALIVLRNDKKTLFNGYLIDEFTGDDDDSTYPDNLELWINEIAYMWAQVPSGAPAGIPGYDILAITFSILISISILSLVYLRKRKTHTI
ncbi:MAG: DUF4350 domain-containing protein [Candidatus Hermodarchaeota archaeon]